MRRLLLAMALLGAASALAAEVSVSAPPFGAVRAGQFARIEWTGVPDAAEELELLLTIEGRELPLRLTPQLDARTASWVWRVPNLPARQASIRVRFGQEGEEIESPPSAIFAILRDGDELPAAIEYRDGEWWADGTSGGRLPGSLGARPEGDGIRVNREAAAPAASSSTPGVGGGRGKAVSSGVLLQPRAFPPPPPLSRKPAEVPARI